MDFFFFQFSEDPALLTYLGCASLAPPQLSPSQKALFFSFSTRQGP
jgi:hypothetical protein